MDKPSCFAFFTLLLQEQEKVGMNKSRKQYFVFLAAPSQERSDLTGHYFVRQSGVLVGRLVVDSYKKFQVSKSRRISKFPKPKCVSGRFEQLSHLFT